MVVTILSSYLMSNEVLGGLENQDHQVSEKTESTTQLPLFELRSTPLEDPKREIETMVSRKIEELKLEETTPLQALTLLSKLKSDLNESAK